MQSLVVPTSGKSSKLLRAATCYYICNRRIGLSLVHSASRDVSLDSRSILSLTKQTVTQSGKTTGKASHYLTDEMGWNPLQILMEFLSDSAAVGYFFFQKQITSASLRDWDFIRPLDPVTSSSPLLASSFCPLLLLWLERDTLQLAGCCSKGDTSKFGL